MPEQKSQSEALSRQLMLGLVTPMVLLLLTGAILALQLTRMSEDAEWVEHTDRVIAKALEVQNTVLEQETAFRGYLLTEDPRMLDSMRASKPRDGLADLRALVADNPQQASRADEIGRRYDNWLEATTGASPNGRVDELRSRASIDGRRQRMEEMRTELLAFIDSERALLTIRIAASESSARVTKIAFAVLLSGAALALAFISRRQIAGVATSYAAALRSEKETRRAIEEENWVRQGQTRLAERMQGDFPLDELGRRVLEALASHLEADVGAFFVSEGTTMKRYAGLALDSSAAGLDAFAIGEGVVGRAAAARHIVRLDGADEPALKARSGTGERVPSSVLVVPAEVEGQLYAVVELAFLKAPLPRVESILRRVGETIALAVRSTQYKVRLRDLLEEAQRQAEELQAQQEELRVANEELEEQSNALKVTQVQLEERQEELEASNAGLEEQRNALEHARRAVSEKAAEAERASRYKSEFLANMSHELRTPLNSSLILAKLLADNKDENLTAEQVRFAQTIYSAGNDLLTLISDILDLSKIEAGKVEIRSGLVPIERLVQSLERTFDPLAKDKGIRFSVELGPGVPSAIETDNQRLEQVLKNLLSNAIKFTNVGTVTLSVSVRGDSLELAVRDTGIGIPQEHLEAIFGAFHQVDAASDRKYGGTGLGLAISRDLARLLGGDIAVESEVGRGSVFRLAIPLVYAGATAAEAAPQPLPSRPTRLNGGGAKPSGPTAPPVQRLPVPDDRAHLDQQRRMILVVEDDPQFARILADLAHEMDFQCLVTDRADEAVELARRHVPSGVLLDINLPDHSGLSVLDRLKRHPTTRHVPVHVVSATDYSQTALEMGAVGYMLKPVKREALVNAFEKLEERLKQRLRRLLIVEDDTVQRESLTTLLGGPGVETVAVGTVEQAKSALRSSTFDCVVTDLTLPDATGFDLLEDLARDEQFAFPPVIVYTGRALSDDDERRLRKYSSSVIVKGARSPERLVDEVTLFLHQVESELPAERQRMIKRARDREAAFEGRTILLAEDDVRNIFALSSILEPKGAKLVLARNGVEALKRLEETPDVDLVLMDVMMPEMDGIQAMRAIRKQNGWAKLPIIALTAKAMKDDQERCLEAGANDYIAKPLDVEKLLSLLRVWMPK